MSLIPANFSERFRVLTAVLTAVAVPFASVAQAVPQAAPAVAPATAATSGTAPAASKAPPDYNAISDKNLFDPQRKPWEEKKEVPPPLPPLTAEDVQIYGIMAVGSFKRAIVKVGGKLKHLAPTDPKARPYIQLNEGQSLGGYTLTEINPQRLIFAAGETRYQVAINKKEDRPTAPPVPVPAAFQDAVAITAETPNGSDGKPMAVAEAPTAAPAVAAAPAAATPDAAAAANAAAGANAAGGQSGSGNADGSSNNSAPAPRPMSLLEAIQQARSQSNGAQPMANPFTNAR